MKYILLTLFFFTLLSCDEMKTKTYTTDKFELRQLVNKTTVSTHESAYLFFAIGGYSKTSTEEETVKVFAKVDGMFRMLEFNLKDIRIQIDNSIKIPSIQYQYRDSSLLSNESLLDRYEWYSDIVIIYCPEIYLPEKLLPITLN